MAGGTWKSQNKTRPGAYVNFKGVAKPLSQLGTRGVMTMPIPMSWGASVTELFSTDLVDGKSLSKIGYTAFDDEALIFREALKKCYKAIIYRLDTSGVKATKALGTLTATAKYGGTVGNKISVAILSNTDSTFTVITYFNDVEKDRQKVSAITNLVPNEWVDFSGTGALTATAKTLLTGGTNGTVTASTAYPSYLLAIKSYKWDTMGIPADIGVQSADIVTFIKSQRDDFGRKVQCVLYNYPDANYEGVISVHQGYKLGNTVVSPQTFVAYVAGLTAGSEVDESNTYHIIEGAKEINPPLANDEIEAALLGGKMVLSTKQNGDVVIEQDINTFKGFIPDKGYAFCKNRVIRTLDEINNSISAIFENSYIGKVDNNEDGRNIFKADIISYCNKLLTIGAIKEFNSQIDIEVLPGDAIDAVIVNLAVKPADAMEKLYMTINVG